MPNCNIIIIVIIIIINNNNNQSTVAVNEIKHYSGLDIVAMTTNYFPDYIFHRNMDFSIFGHCKYFCFVLNCPVALKIITETMLTY